MIRTIIFDLGRVLVHFDFQPGYQRMSAHCGLSAEEVRRRLGSGSLVVDFESGRLDGPAFHKKVEELLETRVDFDEFREMWYSIFTRDELVPESLLIALRRRYRLVVLSNTNPLHFDMLWERNPILRHFDAYVLSHKVGAMKPRPEIYTAAIEAAQCSPAECFFTDDIADYVEGAKRAGIDAVQFVNAEETRKELRARGVEWEE